MESIFDRAFGYLKHAVGSGMRWLALTRDGSSTTGQRPRCVAVLIDANGWTDWSTRAESGGDPWIFYMSREFTDHCLETVDRIIEGVGARVRRVLWTENPDDP